MIILELFWRFFQIGLFSFGGGYAVLPLIRQQIVESAGWLSLTEFTDIVAISQMTPGPIALNAATFVGVRVSGVIGGIIATIGCITPSCIIVLVLARYFFKYREISFMQSILRGLRPAVAALIMAASVSIVSAALLKNITSTLTLPSLSEIDWIAASIFAAAFFMLRKFKVGILPLMAGAAALGIGIYGFLVK